MEALSLHPEYFNDLYINMVRAGEVAGKLDVVLGQVAEVISKSTRTRNKAVNFTKVPWLADIPIVGWFFKNKSEADTRSEVLIFLTPKIVNRASSIGG